MNAQQMKVIYNFRIIFSAAAAILLATSVGVKSSSVEAVINVHNGEFNERTLAQKGFIHCRSDQELSAIIPEPGSANFLHGTMVGIYESVPTEHYAKFANCKSIGLAGLHKLTDDDLKYFSNAEKVDLNGCWSITDEGIKHLKNVRTLYLHGCKVTYQGLCQLGYLKEVYKHTYNSRGTITNEEHMYCRRLLEKGVEIHG